MKVFLRVMCMLFLMVFVVNVGYADVTTTIDKEKIEQGFIVDVDNVAISIPEVMLIEYDNCQPNYILYVTTVIKPNSFVKDAFTYDKNKGLITTETNDFNLQKQLVSKDNETIAINGNPLKTANKTNLALCDNNRQIKRFVKHKGKLEKTYFMSV